MGKHTSAMAMNDAINAYLSVWMWVLLFSKLASQGRTWSLVVGVESQDEVEGFVSDHLGSLPKALS